MIKSKIFLFFTFIFLLFKYDIFPQINISSDYIDSLAQSAIQTFDVPGIAVCVIKDGKIIHSKGYGYRSLATKQEVNEKTLFGIASNTKAFTATALAILIDEGKLQWDDRVIDYIPEFRLYNPYVTEEFTIRDLLTHRSGLGLGAGDLMLWPDSNLFTKKEIIYNLRFLKPVSSFRSKYDYDNLLYVVAGEVIEKVSGMSYEDFIEKRIMLPLGMRNSAASYDRLKNKNNVIDAHCEIDGKVQVIQRDRSVSANAAGGIYSNLEDLSKWVLMNLNKGRYGENLEKELVSIKNHREMQSPQTIIPVKNINSYNTQFFSYGLGWFISNVKSFKQVYHTGGLAGMVTQITLIPEINLGIIVLTNQQVGAAFVSITNAIKDFYLNMIGFDRIKEAYEQLQVRESEADDIIKEVYRNIEEQKSKNVSLPDINKYIGKYNDNWFGEVNIFPDKDKIIFSSVKSPKMIGELIFYNANTYVVKWFDRSFDADAFVTFCLDENGDAIGFRMKAISPLTDFSFDFHDLDFRRLNK